MKVQSLLMAAALTVVSYSSYSNACDFSAGADNAMTSAIFSNDLSCVNQSLQQGANVNKGIVRCSTDGGTATPTTGSYTENFSAIGLASYLGRNEIVKALIAKGADLKATSEAQARTALAWAVEGKHADTASLLIQAGSDVNQKMVVSYVAGYPVTPLLLAADTGDVATAKVLVAAGANLEDVRGDYRWTPLLQALENYDQDKNPAKRDMVKYLISAGANVQYVECCNGGKQGVSSLWYAADAGDIEIAKLLIAKGADVNFQNQETSIWGVLNIAVSNGDVAFVKLLLANKVKVNQKSEGGQTAMHEAARVGNAEMIKLLARNGAYLNEIAKNYEDEQGTNLGDITPLDVAISKGNTAAATTLRALGAKKASEIQHR